MCLATKVVSLRDTTAPYSLISEMGWVIIQAYLVVLGQQDLCENAMKARKYCAHKRGCFFLTIRMSIGPVPLGLQVYSAALKLFFISFMTVSVQSLILIDSPLLASPLPPVIHSS